MHKFSSCRNKRRRRKEEKNGAKVIYWKGEVDWFLSGGREGRWRRPHCPLESPS